MTVQLANKKCIPCSEGAPVLTGDELNKYVNSVNSDWKLADDNKKIVRSWEFPNFRKALDFINSVGELAEELGHHPDFYFHGYKYVRIELFTHKINGLHPNDFILAYRIDQLTDKSS